MSLTRGEKVQCNGVRGGALNMMGLRIAGVCPRSVSVSLEELVPQDHFYRHLQKVLDLSFVLDLVRAGYAAPSRPSIDPLVFLRRQLVRFLQDIVRFAMRRLW